MIIERQLRKKIEALKSKYKVISVIGPRQAGKSTLCKMAFPEKAVLNLEDPEIRKFAELDPKGLLAQHPEGCFIDEIQRVPELLSYIQVDVDNSKKTGKYVISGSHQFSLLKSISQSLAGRTAIVKLLPFAQEEILNIDQNLSINQILVRGSYPEIVTKSLNPSEAFSFYVQTYLERDVREIQAIKDLSLFQSFLSLIAGRSGNILNIASIANELAVAENTVKNWISVAEASFILFRLKPYYKNLSKRQVKSPKIFFYDTGLLCYLLGIRSEEQLQNHPLRGAIFETYVVSEIVKFLFNRVRESNLFFFADNVLEIDLLAETSLGLLPIEIKSAATFQESLLRQIHKSESRLGITENSFLVYTGQTESMVNKTKIISYKNLSEVGNKAIK